MAHGAEKPAAPAQPAAEFKPYIAPSTILPEFNLPGAKTEDSSTQVHLEQIASANYQHPDHDTESWPPQGARR